MRKVHVFLFVFVLFAGVAAFAENVTVAYPNQDHPLFSVTAPGDWEMTPAEEAGGFFDLNAPSGAVISMRAIDGTADDLKGAIQESFDYLNENFKNVAMAEPQQANLAGMESLIAKGTGEDEDGGRVVFVMQWMAMKNGKIAEIWFNAASDDKEGAQACAAVLNTFKAY